MSKVALVLLAVLAVFSGSHAAQAQHLWWNLAGQKDAVCLYGEITVLATHPSIYYCGANWHPGEPAGGYCGIQDIAGGKRWTIFSIWDTSKSLSARIAHFTPPTVTRRFGGEGVGVHTHVDWAWKIDQPFRFYVQKKPGSEPETTDAFYYVYDPATEKWFFSATIRSPNGGHRSVTTLGGGLNSFLENFSGRDREAPKLALYRLWLGSAPDKLTCLTRASGDGKWGQMGDAYFLADGDPERLAPVFAQWEKSHGKAVYGGGKTQLPPITDKPLTQQTLTALKNLPVDAPSK